MFEKLRYDLEAMSNNLNDTPSIFSFVTRAHKGKMCDFYVCEEIYFSGSSLTVHSNIHIMDNLERRANFGLLSDNSY